jgi:hypothetical protein
MFKHICVSPLFQKERQRVGAPEKEGDPGDQQEHIDDIAFTFIADEIEQDVAHAIEPVIETGGEQAAINEQIQDTLKARGNSEKIDVQIFWDVMEDKDVRAEKKE